MISIEELLVPVTGDQQLEKFLVTLEGLGLKPRAWREGGSLRTILRVVADAYAGFATSILGFVKAGFLETATGGWLTLLAYYVYGVTRIAATFATGEIQLTNAGGAVYSGGTAIAAESLRFIGATGKAYTNTAIIEINPGQTLLFPIRAVEIGSASNATPGTILIMETTLAGVSCTNPAAVVGTNEEADADLQQRCKDKLGIIGGKGPRGAYAYAVRSAVRADGSAVDINRLSISPSSSTGTVTIYVASPSGAPAATDLTFIRESVELYARPDSVTATVLAATPVAFTKSLTVWAQRTAGVSAADLSALVSAALLAMITAYPIGGIPKPPDAQGYLYDTTIEGTAKSAHPSIFAIDGVGASLAMSPGQVATLAATVSVTLVDVSS